MAYNVISGLMGGGPGALDQPYSPKRRGSAAALHAAPPPSTFTPSHAPLVHGRHLADIPPPSWPPRLDFRYLGYGDAGPYVPADERGQGGFDAAFRFDGLDDHAYALGPPIGGGGYKFGCANPTARGERPRSRNRLRLASGGGGLDGGSEAVHPDCDPNVPDDGPGPGEYSTPRWPEGPGYGGRGTTFHRGDTAGAGPDRRATRGSAAREGPGPADYETAAAIARFRASYAGAGGARFGGAGAAKGSAPAWRQKPRGVHDLESAMGNARARSGGPFGALTPAVTSSVMHGRPGVLHRPAGAADARAGQWRDGAADDKPRTPVRTAGKGGKGEAWGPEWD